MAKIQLTDPSFNVPVVQLPSPGTPEADVYGAAAKALSTGEQLVETRMREDGEMAGSEAASNYYLSSMQQLDDDRRNGRVTDGYSTEKDNALELEVGTRIKGMTNPYEARAYARGMQSVRRDIARLNMGTENEVRETRLYSQAVHSIENFNRSIAYDPSPQNIEARLLDAENVIKPFADRGQIEIVDKLRVQRAQMAETYVDMLVQTDPKAAQAVLSDENSVVAGVLPGPRVPILMDQAKSEQRRLENDAELAKNKLRATMAGQADYAKKNAISQMMDKGLSPAPETLRTIRDGSTDLAYEQFEQTMKLHADAFNALGDTNTATNAELTKRYLAVQPPLNEKPTDDAAYLRKKAVRSLVTEAYNKTMKLRNTDPGMAGYNASPDVREAWAFAMNEKTPAAVQSAAKKTMAAQIALGVATGRVTTMPDFVAKAMADQLNETPGEMSAGQLRMTQDQFGPELWPKAMQQMQPKMNSAMQIAPVMQDNTAATKLLTNGKAPIADLRKRAFVDEEDADNSPKKLLKNNSTFKSMVKGLLSRKGGNTLADAMIDSGERLALTYMSEGKSGPEATDLAVKKLVSENYTLILGGANRSYRLPRTIEGVDASKVETATNYMRGYVAKKFQDQIRLPGAQPGVTRSWTLAQFRTQVGTNSYWVTSDDESGVVLYVADAPVQLASGREIAYSFKDLNRLGIALPPPQNAFARGKGLPAPTPVIAPTDLPQIMDTGWRDTRQAHQPPVGGPVAPVPDMPAPSHPEVDPSIALPDDVERPDEYKPPAFDEGVRDGDQAPPRFP